MTTQTAQHTSGEWRVNDQTQSGWMDNAVYVTSTKGHVCRVYSEAGNPLEIASLIAAAPQTANECERLRRELADEIKHGEWAVNKLQTELADAKIINAKLLEALEQVIAGGYLVHTAAGDDIVEIVNFAIAAAKGGMA